MEKGLSAEPNADVLKFSNPREVAEGFITATKKLVSGEFGEADARAMLDALLKAGQKSALKVETVRTTFESWLRGKALSKSDRTTGRYATVVSKFLKHLGVKTEQSLSAVSIRDIEAFRDARLKENVSGRTVSVDIKIIRGVFENARRQGVISHNPAQGCELPKRKSNERETFTPEEISKLIGAATGEWKTAIYLGYFLGARLEDAVTMTWESMDFSAHTVVYRQRKTGRVVTAPLHPDLLEHLRAFAVCAAEKGYVTPELASKAGKGDGNLSKQFGRIMVKAKVDSETEKEAGRRAFSKKSFHSLRHSFASHLANSGVADEIRMRLTGHTSDEVHQRYTHIELEPLRVAVGKLPSIRANLVSANE